MIFAILAGVECGALRAQDIAGTWQGVIEAGNAQRVVMKITKDAAAGWRGALYNLDSIKAYEPRATTQMSLQGMNLRFVVASIDASYAGRLSDDKTVITGTWTQGGAAHLLNLARATGDAAWEIPKAGAVMAKDADPNWDVVTVKARDPNDPSGNASIGMQGSHFALINRTVESMLMAAYGVQKSQIVGAPHWIETEKWDVQGVPDVPGRPSLKQMQSLIRKVLAERFGLKLHKELRELPVYAITLARGGDKMVASAGDPNGLPDESDNSSNGLVTMRVSNMAMNDFAMIFQFFLDRPAVNQTGLAGRYDFQLKWTPDESRGPSEGSAPPGLFTAIQEQIGLKLEPVKAPAQVLVIDALQRGSAN